MNNSYLSSQLSTQERILVNSEVEKERKSTTVAFLLCLFFGTLGGHRYYMGKTGSAVAMTLITVLSLGFGVIVTGIWAFVDLFMISSWLRDDQNQIEERVAIELLNERQRNNGNNFSTTSDDEADEFTDF